MKVAFAAAAFFASALGRPDVPPALAAPPATPDDAVTGPAQDSGVGDPTQEDVAAMVLMKYGTYRTEYSRGFDVTYDTPEGSFTFRDPTWSHVPDPLPPNCQDDHDHPVTLFPWNQPAFGTKLSFVEANCTNPEDNSTSVQDLTVETLGNVSFYSRRDAQFVPADVCDLPGGTERTHRALNKTFGVPIATCVEGQEDKPEGMSGAQTALAAAGGILAAAATGGAACYAKKKCDGGARARVAAESPLQVSMHAGE